MTYWVYTCKRCGHNNPDKSTVCNGCGRQLEGMFGSHKYERWVCSNCNNVNMKENRKCLCGEQRSKTGGENFVSYIIWGYVLLFILGIISGK